MAKISNQDILRSEANVKLAQDFIERNKGKTNDELKVIAKNSKMSSSEKRQLLDYLEKNSTRELNKSLSYGDINNSEKLMGTIYDDTPSKQKASRKDILALSNTKYTNTLLEKILQTQNDTAMSENTLKYQQQVVSNLNIMQADIKQLVEFMKPKEIGETQAERKELEMGVSDMAKAMSTLDFNSMMKEFGKGVFKQFDTDGTGELLGSMLGMFKEQIQEGSFGATIKDMIKETILDKMPMGNEIRRWQEDPVGFSQEMINRLGMSDNAGLRSLFKSHIKGMKPNITPQIKKIDMSAAAKFDNKVYTSLTRIIPEQLYKMVALLSGKEERRFDWERQTYRNVSNMMADEYNKTTGKSLTYQVDSQMREIGANIEDSALTNVDIKNMLQVDADGKVIKDGNTGLPMLKNRGAVRQVVSNIIKSGCTLPDVIYGEPAVVIKQWRLDKGFKPNELQLCLEATKFLKAYYNSLNAKDRASAIDDFKYAKQELDNQEVSELWQSLDEEQREYYQSVLNNQNLTVEEMRQLFKNINIRGARVDIGPGAFGNSGYGTRNTTGPSDKELQDHKDVRSGNAAAIDAISKATGRELTDKEKDDRYKFMSDLANNTDLDKTVQSKDIHNGTNEFSTYASTNREKLDFLTQYLDAKSKEELDSGRGVNIKNAINVNGRVKDVTLASIKDSIMKNDKLTADQERVFKSHLTRLNRAIELYNAYDNAGLTAKSVARLLGVSPNSVKNKLRGPEDLMEFINEDGSIDVNKLKAFTASSGVDLSYIDQKANEDVLKEYSRSQRGSISGGLKGSITNTLSAIFGDPKIANKAGIAVGSAAGLGIAQLLKNEGIISSPKAQYLLAAVGGGLMSMERTRKYMQNVFGPEGDIKNAQGVTNKEIFFAKAMEKYLPMVGAGAATYKFVSKAMKSFGPLGKVVGFPLAVITGGLVGAAAPHMLKWAQRSLFDREKDDQSWMAKLGRFLKDIPFVKKYFDVTGIQSPGQIKIRSLEAVRSNIQAEIAQLEANDNLTEDQKARLANLKDKLSKIEKLQADIRESVDKGTDSDEANAKEQDDRISALMKEINKDYAVDSRGDFVTNDKGQRSVTKESSVNYEEIQSTAYERTKHANDLKSAMKNSGESVSDMNYTDHFTGNTGELVAGIKTISEYKHYSPTRYGANGKIQSKPQNYSVKELYAMSEENRNKVLSEISNTDNEKDKEFLRRFQIYKNLRDAGINLEDSEDAGVSFNEYVRSEFEKFMESDRDAAMLLHDVEADDASTIQDILGDSELVKALNNISTLKLPENRKRAFEEWKTKVGEEKLKEIDELNTDNAAKDVIIQKLYDITKNWVELGNYGREVKMTPREIEMRTNQMMARSYSVDMLTKVLENKFSKSASKIATKIKTFLEPGNDTEVMAKHKELMDLYTQLSGGKGSNDKSKTKSNARIKMSELSDKKFKTGERLSVAGCSVAALNNALLYMGVTTVDVDTLITIANNHLTSNGGVSSDFFKEVGDKLGVEVTIYNNKDNKFTPESLMEVKPGGTNGLIILLKNKDGNGFHYVTAKKINSKTVVVDDPELNNSNTVMSTGDICVRAQELIVLKKVKDVSVLKESPLTAKMNQIKSVFTTGRDMLGRVQKDGLVNTIKNVGKKYLNDKVVNPLLKSTIPMTGMSVKDMISGGVNNTANIVKGILDGLKDMVLNFRMVEDMTLPLRLGDPDAARAVANSQSTDATDKISKMASQKAKKLVANKDVMNAFNEEDKTQDAIMALSSVQNPGMVAGASTGAGGKGSGKNKDNPDAPHQSGPLGFVKDTMDMLIGAKDLGLVKSLGKAASIGALATVMYQGYKRVGKPMFELAKDQAKRGLANLPIFGTRQEEEYKYDENGMVVSGQHKDVTGGFRNLRDAANVVKVGLGSIGAGVKGLEKVAKLSNSSIGVVSKVGKYADDILTNSGTIGKILTGIGKFCNALIKGMNKVGLGKIGFVSNGAEALFGTVKDKLGKWVTKIIPKLAKAGAKKGSEGFLKKLPLLGSAISLAQGVWAFIDGYRHSEAYTGVDPDRLDWKQKAKVGIAKAFYDAGVEFILSLANTILPGAGTTLQIGWSVLRATGAVRLDAFLSLFGVGKDDLEKQITEEVNKEKAAENKINGDIDKDTENSYKKAKEVDPETRKAREDYNRAVMLVGKNQADKLAEQKWGENWQDVLYPNKSKSRSNVQASKNDVENIQSTEFTAQHEGFRNKMYYDSENKRTIGYGFNLDSGRFKQEDVDRWLKEGISEEEAKEVLQRELSKTRQDLEKYEWFKKLDPVRQGAIVDMAYNMGTGKDDGSNGGVNSFKNMIAALEKGDYDTAASEVLNSKYASQTGVRAAKISSLIRYGSESGTTAADINNKESLAASKVYDSFVQKSSKGMTEEDRAELLKNMENNPDFEIWKKRGGDWEHPLKNRNTVITSAFGWRDVEGGSKNHKGVDFRGDETTPVFATKDGSILQSSQAGGEIQVKHTDGTTSIYRHLSKRLVKVGDEVKSGDKLGFVGGIGDSGRKAFNAHLHYEMLNKHGSFMDPFIQLGLDPSVFKLGPGGKENEDYLKRNNWLLAQSQKEAEKLAQAEKLNSGRKDQPEKLGPSSEKGGPEERSKRTAADYNKYDNEPARKAAEKEFDRSSVVNLINSNSQAIEMLSKKFDQMIQLLSQIANATGQISNNSMSDFNAPSVIR